MIEESFQYYFDKFNGNKSFIIKIFMVSILLASITTYSIITYLSPVIKSRMSEDGTYFGNDMGVLFLIVLILFAFSFLMLIVNVVIAFVLNCLKPVYFSFAFASLIFDVIYIMFVGKISVLMFVDLALSYAILFWTIGYFIRFVFNRKILV